MSALPQYASFPVLAHYWKEYNYSVISFYFPTTLSAWKKSFKMQT